MQHRDDHRDRELEAEAQRDVDDDQRERDEDPPDRVDRNLVSEARRDVLRAARERADLLLQLVLEVALARAAERAGAHLPRRVLAVDGRAATLHDRVRAFHLGGDRADLVRRVRLVRLERDLRAALEVDAEVQPAHAERDGARDDDHA